MELQLRGLNIQAHSHIVGKIEEIKKYCDSFTEQSFNDAGKLEIKLLFKKNRDFRQLNLELISKRKKYFLQSLQIEDGKIYNSLYSENGEALQISLGLIRELSKITDFFYLSDHKLDFDIDKIYCRDNLCPFCESKMNKKEEYLSYSVTPNIEVYECINNCYKLSRSKNKIEMSGNFQIIGQNHYVDLDESIEERIKALKEISEEIDYWREGDRYLAEILKK
ncbi:gp444 [Bacillus phage G]|uniref:Gp444 n=1 Tax=Bacillus phage G TaxID=2884420 RepID=G3MAI5_9CAUD|nr:gp444 [Bacillus phage G]AEO93702.1 gp444 [Bacillus phage G]